MVRFGIVMGRVIGHFWRNRQGVFDASLAFLTEGTDLYLHDREGMAQNDEKQRNIKRIIEPTNRGRTYRSSCRFGLANLQIIGARR